MIFRKVLSILFLSMASMMAMAQATPNIYYVKVDGNADGTSWDQATTLSAALDKAKAGDQIFVMGYDQEHVKQKEYRYYVPAANKRTGFQLKAGVKLYGGFKDHETKEERDARIKNGIRYKHTYQSCLTADGDIEDVISNDVLIFPENETRNDNAYHVLTMDLKDGGSTSTVLDGFVIAAGNAAGSKDEDEGHGGGVFVTSSTNNTTSTYEISQCFFVNNYGSMGGAIYVDKKVQARKTPQGGNDSYIQYCGIYNNASGSRSSNNNLGGGIYLSGAGVVHNSVIYNNMNGGVLISNMGKVVNCTIVHNSSSATDLEDESQAGTSDTDGGTIYNTVIWGNSSLCKNSDNHPTYRYCAFPDVTVTNKDKGTDAHGNKYISTQNITRSEDAAWLSSPTTYIGYDRSFNSLISTVPTYSMQPEQESALLNSGSLSLYTSNVGNTQNTDLANNTRFATTIDIGAYEQERLSGNRRRYVKVGGTGNGMSWADAMGDVQKAIDDLAKTSGQKGEVWIAKGVYVPSKITNSDGSTLPISSFVMRDGISVYGGFSGEAGETVATRARKGSNFWEFTNETKLIGSGSASQQDGTYKITNATWNSNNNEWNVSSSSSHVVWFVPLAGATTDFANETILDGVTIMGGSAQQTLDEGDYRKFSRQGAGVYMASTNAILRNSIITNNNAGKSKSVEADAPSQGGGVYCKYGQVRYSLVYNNSAASGGGVYLEDAGFINKSMVSNNSANNGAGVYLKKATESLPDYLILASSIISNNTSTENGAVYVDGAGLMEQNTIVNNYTSNVTDVALSQTSRTAGLYITKKALVINNILWNNSLYRKNSKATSSSLAQTYAGTDANKDNVLFYNNAISDVNAVAWNRIYQSGTVEIASTYQGNIFALGDASQKQYLTASSMEETLGVQASWEDGITYFWKPVKGAVVRNRGLLYGQLPTDVWFKPSTDFLEQNFATNPPIGAYHIEAPLIVFEKRSSGNSIIYRLYHNSTNYDADSDGSSWNRELFAINEGLSYIAGLTTGSSIQVLSAGVVTEETIPSTSTVKFEICCREGKLVPSMPYTFQEYEPKSKSIQIPASTFPITIMGGYPAKETNPEPTDEERDIKKYRTEFTGNTGDSDLADGLFHIFRIETGAKITLDGIAITKGYAAGNAFIPYGGGVLIGSTSAVNADTHVTLHNCILENNTAAYGAAISVMPGTDVRNVNLVLENCVVNNNTSDHDKTFNAAVTTRATSDDRWAENVIQMNDESNKLSLYHVTIVNNIGKAPEANIIGKSSFAAGNEVYKSEGSRVLATDNARNTQTIQTMGKEGAANFSNPTLTVGAKINGNVYYGGNAEFRPLTGSLENDAIINRGVEDATYPQAKDIVGNDRNLGGAPDLGAYEAILPKAGKVIYVRSYNTDYQADDCIDGTPDFNLLNENKDAIYDGTTWSRAIMGNAVCDVTQERKDNDFYVTETDGKLIAASLDESRYADGGTYGPTSGAYSNFFPSGTSGKDNGNKTNVTANSSNKPNSSMGNGTQFNKITNDRYEQYISGLQYAVEKAAEYNKNHPAEEPMVVWVGAGVYTDYKGFVIRDGVKVYGGFCKDGNPSENDRRPLLSQYVPARKQYQDLKKSDYETILQIRKETPVYMTNSSKELWYSEGKPTDGSQYDYAKKLIDAGTVTRHYVLYQPDVCLPTWGISGDGLGTPVGANQYRYPGFGSQEDHKNYHEYKNVTWDGFSIRHGYITNYEANRDGGSGVRVFRGIRLENLIIVNNLTHGRRSRGGGLYMDGDNSVISNSYLLQNLVWGNKDCYGGGAYMIQGVGYNMVVASNRSLSQGGGIFIESAKFYNNTVAYNMANNVQGTGIMHWQDNTTGISSQLTLYNCLVYDNMLNNGVTAGTTQIGSSSPDRFQTSYNNYVNSDMGNLADKFTKENGNVTGGSIAFPFAVGGYGKNNTKDIRWRTARLQNDFRLNEPTKLADNPCLNGGTEAMPNIPATDMDYTDRIKDCTIDIGAYEADNTANIKPQEKVNVENTTKHEGVMDYVYYVTQNGAGNRSGYGPENAACASKLQSVLTAAGVKAATVNSNITENDKKSKVYVKVAGYKTDDDGKRFVYHANTLADPEDPQSYTFLIPDGVWLMGGYYEGGEYGEDGKEIPANWDDDKRDIMTNYRTVLSAKTEPKLGSAVEQEINGYHAVTFGKWPSDQTMREYNSTAIPYRATLDGVTLTDGLATDDGFKGMGGAAIIPEHAHIRNCIISGCEANKGGGVYLLPGSMITGSILKENTAKEGGAVYAAVYDPSEGSVNFHAYLMSCTIAGNNASVGGGISQELGAIMVGNTVIWGNKASTDNNVSGVVDQTFEDQTMNSLTKDDDLFYPYNNCYVEKYVLPANTWNREMESDMDTYFTSNGEYYPRPYSVLVEGGVSVDYYQAWAKLAGVLLYDVLGVDRNSKAGGQVTAGAYAMTLPFKDTNSLLKRLFVSNDGGAEVSAEVKQKYLGRSFYTPFNTLDAALAYITKMRETKIQVATGSGTSATTIEMPLATDTTKFEILMTGGVYKPTTMRENEDVTAGQTVDRRLNSFVIPVNVNIFGSFAATDPYSSNPITLNDKGEYINVKDDEGNDDNFTSLTDENNQTIELKPNVGIKNILNYRNTDEGHMVDQNLNGLIEPWEFANPTVLDGDIKESATEKKVYHVVFSKIRDTHQSSAANDNDVMLDGITIQNGETHDKIRWINEENGTEDISSEIGHGAGIYSYDVSYTLNRCRVMNNIGIHGGGIYVKDGSLDIINSFIGGNLAGSESGSLDADAGKGGGVFVYISDNASDTDANRGNFHAVNSIFVNNSAKGLDNFTSEGGAIYVRRAENTNINYHDMFIMNCIIAKNTADVCADVSCGDLSNTVSDTNQKFPIALYNSVLWNNEGSKRGIDRSNMWHCASDNLKGESTVARSADGNIDLDKENSTATGPRFKSPTTIAGSDGFNYMAKWNPFSISVLTDAGDGNRDAANKETGKYLEWWNLHVKRLPAFGYDDDNSNYIRIASASQERASGKYSRFMGAMNEDGTITNKPIDIGFYEFQYNSFSLSDHEALFVGTTDEGLADGSSWENQTSDLRGAIIAMANPTGNKENLRTDRKVYVRDGEYYSPTLTSGDAYRLTVNNTSELGKLVSSVEIMGACTGNLNNIYEQDFSHQTVLVPNEQEESATNNLLNISTNGRPVTVSGFTFKNTCDKEGENVGVGVNINDDTNAQGRVIFKNCAFRKNNDNGLNIGNLAGGVLIYNTLFADGKKNGISTKDKLDVLNATFVKNQGTDIENNSGNDGNVRIANSVSWKNGSTILNMDASAAPDANNNKLFAANVDNEDVMKGPNFADPTNEDYRIRPSYMLLNKGSNNKYIEYLRTVNTSFDANNLKEEKDLGNLARLTGESVDIGAYECDTKLQPIIYVTPNGNGSGESWASATNDLQGAVNLAELYANTNNASPYGYVFVEAGVTAKDVNITLPGIKVYGTMNGNETVSDEKDLTKKEDIDATVSEVLSKRKGVLEQGSFSAINGMTMNFNNNATTQATNVIDGFMLRGTLQLNNGYISTSVLDSEATLTASASTTAQMPTLYNTLALGTVTGNIKSVNVTATGDLPTTDGNGFNRTKVTTTNPYVTAAYWKYQLVETDQDNLDPANNTNAALTEACIAIVGHRADLAGNKRIRNNVDNGCFETWRLIETYTADANDYPHGKSVIYVDEDKELKLDKTFYTELNNFSPGFILLKYHAGLRGGGSYINLDNLAVERKLKKGEYDMCVMPFSVTQTEIRDIESNDNASGEGYTTYSYNGSDRAKYNYKYDSTNGSAWREGQLAGHATTDGMMLAATRNQTVRYYGTSYTENKALVVRLRQSNYAEDWDETHPSSTKFVAKENMGWNLFGSPYLCAMNYADMEYSRVIYVWKNGNYSKPINTEEQTTGYIPAFDAVFTQTATLSSEEQFYVTQSTELNGGAYETSESQNLSVMLTAQSHVNMTRSANSSVEGDELQMNIVSPSEANTSFGMGSDGVKFMSSHAPQLYAIRNGGRYSLLSAVSEEGSVNVGVSLPASGVYSFTVPEDCDASKYEAVTLKDAQTGKAVDLLQGEYEFMAPEAGEINNRFSISFNRMEDDLQDSNIKVWIAGSKVLMVSGIQEGDLINVYTASGQLDATVEAVSSLAKVYLNSGGLMLVEVVRDGTKVAVKKITVK